MRAHTLDEIKELIPKGSRLKVIDFADPIYSGRRKIKMVSCECECGSTIIARIDKVLSGHTKSCTCLQKDIVIERNKKYDGNVLLINKLYISIMTRCYSVKHPSYGRYGGKGVTVCDEWRNSYPAFLKWCLENGWEKGLHIDKDIIGTSYLYSPENCIFVTPHENLSYPKRATRERLAAL